MKPIYNQFNHKNHKVKGRHLPDCLVLRQALILCLPGCLILRPLVLRPRLFHSILLKLSLVLFALFSYVVHASHGSKIKYTSQQTMFLEAEKALAGSNWIKFRDKATQLANYPLKPYLRRDYLLKKWHENKNNLKLQKNIKSFINQHATEVVSRKIRSKWLQYLADNKKTSEFFKYYQTGFGKKLTCKNAEFKLNALEDKSRLKVDLLKQVESIWLVGHSLPKSCDGMIKEWSKFSYPNQVQLKKRVALALKNKQKRLAKFLAKQLSKFDGQLKRASLLFTSNPLKPVAAQHAKTLGDYDSLTQQVLSSSLIKLAWKNPRDAVEYWQKNEDKLRFNNTQKQKLKRAIALSLSIEKNENAKNWLVSLDSDEDPSVNQWLLSIAINEQNWALIEHLARLKNRQSTDLDKWRYWRAISVNQLGHKNASKRLLENLSKERSYYGFLASMKLDQNAQLNNEKQVVDLERYSILSNSSEAKRAFELFQLNRLGLARSEWNNLIAKSDQNDLTTLANIAHNWGWEHQSILAFAKSKNINDISKRFPLFKLGKYRQESNKYQLPTSWAYAITRQESAFKVDAISSAGAKGLMQLTDKTAKQVYRNNRLKSQHQYLRSNQLLQADTNIELGIAHLSELLKQYNGHPILATAAYNAGIHRVNQWLQENKINDPIVWIEQIPYKETREYVKNVLTYQEIYSQLTLSNDSFIANISHYKIPVIEQVNIDSATR